MWWYGLGWVRLMHGVGVRIQGVLQFFSVGLLLGSLFAPYRQISAGRVRGNLQAELQALGDRLFSRLIGAVIRLMLILTGLATALLVALFGLVVIAVWPVLPVAPLVGVFLMQAGVGR